MWLGINYGNGTTLGVPSSYVRSEVIEQLNVTGVSKATGGARGMSLSIVRTREHQPPDEFGRGKKQNYHSEIIELVEFDLPTVGAS